MEKSQGRLVRGRIIDKLLTDTSVSEQTLAQVLTQEKFFSRYHQNSPVVYAGGIVKEDLRGSDISLFEICEALQDRLVEELDVQIQFIMELLPNNEDVALLTPELMVQRLHNLVEEVPGLEEDVDLLRKRVREIVSRIKEVHIKLQVDLSESLGRHLPALDKRRTAEDALTATSIETSLVKLSLLRAQCHQALYNFKSETRPDATMANALQVAYDSLKEEGFDLAEEEHALDLQISEYQALLELVDGEHVGFGQLVDDWVRVQKGTEDCRRDLRRLGWTEAQFS